MGLLHPFCYSQSASSSNVLSYEREIDMAFLQMMQRRSDSIQRAEDSIRKAYNRVISMPENVLFLMAEQRGEDAEKAYKKFRDTLPKQENPFYIDFLDKEFFGKMAAYGASSDRRSYYKRKSDAMLTKLKRKYPDNPLVIWYDIDYIAADDSMQYNILRLCDRVVEADTTYLPSYMGRAMTLFQLGRIKEACQDLFRLPECIRREIPESIRCVNFSHGR